MSVRRTVLDVLTRPRLQEIGPKTGIECYRNTSRPDMLDWVSRSHGITFPDLLAQFLHDELNLACQKLHLDDTGRQKEDLDFVIRVRNESTTTTWIIETKRAEDSETEVSRKDGHAEWWCEQVTKKTATGVEFLYPKLPHHRYHGHWSHSFAALVKSLKPAPGLKLTFESVNEEGATSEYRHA